MHHFLFRLVSFITVVLISFSCTTTKRITQISASISSLKYLGGYEIPFNFKYKNTIAGGLSGIDYDAASDIYYLISDDRNDHNPVRFYTAKIFFTRGGIDSLIFIEVINILQPDGNIYPNRSQDPFKNPDPEAIRYNPVTKYLAWCSEGERVVKRNDTVLVDPAVIIINATGNYIDSFTLPANLEMEAIEKGPRRNGVLEGMTFAGDYRSLFVNTEEPLYQDGPSADLADNNAFIRIFKFDVATKTNTAQYAYKLEPVAFAANPSTGFKVNGASDILSIGNDKLLVIERSFSTGRIQNTIKLFIADLKDASDIRSITMKNNQSFIPLKKTLLLNMDDLGIHTDNIEGVTFGPLLPNGHKTLLFIADNNFSELQKAQVLLFEVLE